MIRFCAGGRKHWRSRSPIRTHKFTVTTESDHPFNIAPNLLKQDSIARHSTARQPTQKCPLTVCRPTIDGSQAGAITCVRTREGPMQVISSAPLPARHPCLRVRLFRGKCAGGLPPKANLCFSIPAAIPTASKAADSSCAVQRDGFCRQDPPVVLKNFFPCRTFTRG